MKETQDINKKVDKLLRSKRHNHLSKYKRGIMIIGTLMIIGMVAAAGIIGFVYHGNVSFDIKGKERWLTINDNPIPYNQNLNIEIDSGDSGVISYQINNTWIHPITIYTSISGFTNLTVDLETIGELVLDPGSTWCNFSYESDPWSYDDTVTGIIYFNTTSG